MDEEGLDKLREKDTIKRSAVKSIIYRALMVLSDFVILYLFSGKLIMSVGFAIVNNIWNTIAYFGYDRIWDKIQWGKIIYKTEKKNKLF
jgi:adenylylsulfate kinase